MLGKYHIIHANAQPIQRRVRCYETGRYHRHNTHVEEFFRSACGETFTLRQNDACNITIANPNWDKNWCHDCVKAFPWTEEARGIWREKHSIETLDHASWEKWVRTSEGSAL